MPPTKKATPARPRKSTTTRRASTSGDTASSSSTSSRRLPEAGALVSFDATDPLTGEQLQGLGIVVDAYSHGTGKDAIHRVNLTRLTSDLNLSADDVHEST